MLHKHYTEYSDEDLIILKGCSWDMYFINMCKAVAKKSKDPSTQVGAVIVGPNHEVRSTGWNGFPRGVIDYAYRYNDRDIKYSIVCHAETNAIYNAARVGIPLDNCSIYIYPLFPCINCMKGIIQVGIKEVISIKYDKSLEIWKEEFKTSKIMMDEAHILFRTIEDLDDKRRENYS